KEESIGFLFNLEVQVEEAPAPAAAPTLLAVDGDGAAAATGALPALPTDEEQPVQHVPPALRAKGLDVSRPARMEYSAPSLDGAGGVSHRAADDDVDGDGE